MKKLLNILLLLPLIIFGQVPQGVGYQAVATDANGIELVNQAISIRASILSISATGTIEWQETHNTSTDSFGLFNLTIVQGTTTGNGFQTSFSDISWGANTHFLKIEMDVTGGSTYSNMGTNQMMSVPYALYAENANIDYDSIATLLSIDSTFLTTINVGSGDGINLTLGNRYPITINWNARFNSSSPQSPIGTASIDFVAQTDGFLTGTAMCPNPGYVYFHSDTISSPLTVRGKMASPSYGTFKSFCFVLKKGETYRFSRYAVIHSVNQPWTFYGDVSDCYFTEIDSSASLSPINYDSISTLLSNDSTFITSIIGGIGGGCDFRFPEGIYGESIIHEFSTNYTVPAGKNLYIINLRSTHPSNSLELDGIPVFSGYSNTSAGGYGLKNPVLATSGQVLSHFTPSSVINGYLVDENYFVDCGGESSSTSNLDSTTIANMITAALPPPAVQIGEFRDGGVVFWVDGSGQHGLVCDIQDLGVVEWGCNGTLISGADGTTIGSGIQNTLDILAGCSTAGIAADLCSNSNAQGYNDWFLPSKDALDAMHNNQSDINFTSIFNGGNAFDNWWYWSSKEHSATASYMRGFHNNLIYNDSKSGLYTVRAVRVF